MSKDESSRSPQSDGTLFTIAEIAQRGKVSPKTIRRLIDRGELKSRRISTRVRISGADWQAYLEGGEPS